MEESNIDNRNAIELKDIDSLVENPMNNNSLNEQKSPFLENSEQNKEFQDNNKLNTLYGNDITIKCPKKIGNMRAFLYYKDNPLIVIGPDCK